MAVHAGDIVLEVVSVGLASGDQNPCGVRHRVGQEDVRRRHHPGVRRRLGRGGWLVLDNKLLCGRPLGNLSRDVVLFLRPEFAFYVFQAYVTYALRYVTHRRMVSKGLTC